MPAGQPQSPRNLDLFISFRNNGSHSYHTIAAIWAELDSVLYRKKGRLGKRATPPAQAMSQTTAARAAVRAACGWAAARPAFATTAVLGRACQRRRRLHSDMPTAAAAGSQEGLQGRYINLDELQADAQPLMSPQVRCRPAAVWPLPAPAGHPRSHGALLGQVLAPSCGSSMLHPSSHVIAYRACTGTSA